MLARSRRMETFNVGNESKMKQLIVLILVSQAFLFGESFGDDSPVSKALLCLDQAIELSLTIKTEQEKSIVYGYLKELKDTIQSDFGKKDFSSIQKECLYFYENIDEIVAELDFDLRTKISSCICLMMEEVDGNL